ncbi:Coenzyme PQQ synthesis protein E [uncultured archaeon]|nr:Coenzyme PQQ synthesis protein E [uncultured archaeon]
MLKHVTLDGVRLHLKPDENKLWINSKYVLFLNDTTRFILEAMIESCYEVSKEKIPEKTVKKIVRKYRVSKEKARQDFDVIIGVLNSFARDEPPLHLIGMTVLDQKNMKAPSRMDLSLTYQCNNSCPHCYLKENTDAKGTLDTQQWKTVIDTLWEVGVPQVVFTGGECMLREDLVELVRYSKQFTTGIITNGTLLSSELARLLRDAHLYWIQITLEAATAAVHDDIQGRKGAWKETVAGIKNAVAAGLSVSVNATLSQKNAKVLKGLIDLAQKLNVRYVSTNAIINAGRGIAEKEESGLEEQELRKILEEACSYAKSREVSFNWFLPTCYKNVNPMELGFGQRCCSACSVNMMIEPNGDVIPCQSWTQQKLGNILADPWEQIWNNPVAKDIRNHVFVQEGCTSCEHLELCQGACPLDHLNAGGSG